MLSERQTQKSMYCIIPFISIMTKIRSVVAPGGRGLIRKGYRWSEKEFTEVLVNVLYFDKYMNYVDVCVC